MKRIGSAAEADGLDVEYVLCSADPDSVDGVYIPAWHVGYVDGTAPHVQDVRLPGAAGAYLDLGQFYDLSALRSKKNEIAENQRQYRALYADIYAELAAFDCPYKITDAPWRKRASSRFYRAICHKGCMSLYPRKCTLVAKEAAADFAENASALIEIRHPLFAELTEGFYLPLENKLYRIILTDAETALDSAVRKVQPLLKQAKAMHDELEQIYHPYVDFNGVTALAEKHIKMLKNENKRL
ncbi:MAG: hypothetical protein IIY04_04950 [Oscillospiraceae bacterium]|nr:hypothetical protein [Oscillospiraceae bacterium]